MKFKMKKTEIFRNKFITPSSFFTESSLICKNVLKISKTDTRHTYP